MNKTTIKTGQKVAPGDGVIENINAKTVDIRFPKFTKWHTVNTGVTGENVLVRYDKTFLYVNNSGELQLLDRAPGDNSVFEQIV